MSYTIQTYLKMMLKNHASDLHLKVGRPALFRLDGRLVPVKTPNLTLKELEEMLMPLISESKKKSLEVDRQIDFSFMVPDQGRFRCNVFYQRGTIAAAIRLIPFEVPDFSSLGLPSVLKDLSLRESGLFLVTGSTGAGKSTTLAALVQYLNQSTAQHILTIEDPIEFVFKDDKSTITQREIGSDAVSFSAALRGGLRQDPDVIMIGELRDCETIQAAITAAETGHLVIGTIHTSDARSTLDRIIDVFPAGAKDQVRIQLASSLIAIVSQKLIVRKEKSGRVAISEVMVKSPLIESFIFKNEFEKIPDAMKESGDYYKMQTFNSNLEKLIRSNLITAEEGISASNNPEDLKLRLSGIERQEGYRAAG